MPSFAIGMALLLALASLAIGTCYVVNPATMTPSFGLPMPDDGTKTAWWLRLKGVRDCTSGLLILAFMIGGARREIGIILLVQTMIPVGDMLLILAAKGSTRSAFGIHATTAVVMVLTAVALLNGGH